MVFFVSFSRTLGGLANHLAAATGLKPKHSVLVALLIMVVVTGALVAFGVVELVHHVPRIRQGVDTIVETIRGSPLWERYRNVGGHVTAEQMIEQVRHHASDAVGVAAAIGRETLMIFIALVFSVVFLLEREDLESWREA